MLIMFFGFLHPPQLCKKTSWCLRTFHRPHDHTQKSKLPAGPTQSLRAFPPTPLNLTPPFYFQAFLHSLSLWEKTSTFTPRPATSVPKRLTTEQWAATPLQLQWLRLPLGRTNQLSSYCACARLSTSATPRRRHAPKAGTNHSGLGGWD